MIETERIVVRRFVADDPVGLSLAAAHYQGELLLDACARLWPSMGC